MTSTFLGREQELAALLSSIEQALAGRGGVTLIVGEPGIGKTRTVEELAAYAHGRGMQVLWGRCYEGEGAPAFWPWLQKIRRLLRGHTAEELAAIAQIVDELRDRLPDLPDLPALAPEQARFRLFDSIATFLIAAASNRPLFLILDDLHWADAPSLLLLQILAPQLAQAQLVVVGAYRDTEVHRNDPLARTLPALTRVPNSIRLHLRGLPEANVARFIVALAGIAAPAALVKLVTLETEGNPFFLIELVRLLGSDGRLLQRERERNWRLTIPPTVREVVGRRLEQLSSACLQLLALAAVLGREFSLAVLGEVQEGAADRAVQYTRRVAEHAMADVCALAGRGHPEPVAVCVNGARSACRLHHYCPLRRYACDACRARRRRGRGGCCRNRSGLHRRRRADAATAAGGRRCCQAGRGLPHHPVRRYRRGACYATGQSLPRLPEFTDADIEEPVDVGAVYGEASSAVHAVRNPQSDRASGRYYIRWQRGQLVFRVYTATKAGTEQLQDAKDLVALFDQRLAAIPAPVFGAPTVAPAATEAQRFAALSDLNTLVLTDMQAPAGYTRNASNVGHPAGQVFVSANPKAFLHTVDEVWKRVLFTYQAFSTAQDDSTTVELYEVIDADAAGAIADVSDYNPGPNEQTTTIDAPVQLGDRTVATRVTGKNDDGTSYEVLDLIWTHGSIALEVTMTASPGGTSTDTVLAFAQQLEANYQASPFRMWRRPE